jgi:anti-repressor protein
MTPLQGLCISDCAKVLGMSPKTLFAWLAAHQWIFKRPEVSAWNAYQTQLNRGHVIMQAIEVKRKDQTTKIVTQVRITDRGLAHLRQRLTCAA